MAGVAPAGAGPRGWPLTPRAGRRRPLAERADYIPPRLFPVQPGPALRIGGEPELPPPTRGAAVAVWNPRANEIFANAIELPAPDERRAYLDGACGGDGDLRRQVESLLVAHDQAGRFLDDPAPGDATHTHDPDAAPPTTAPAGQAEDIGTRIGP